ncbi:hypothetical protein Prum_011920 [Phytohabitans rumicis]|uniref:Uncharacterized protein n=1 Tax=Phytohabitans rumicis TaxID=1076125 RepID=A0A6V8KVZ6_9ACTN|nr:hypothetical protein Prum_011920 [Phytohabitans rumicis]
MHNASAGVYGAPKDHRRTTDNGSKQVNHERVGPIRRPRSQPFEIIEDGGACRVQQGWLPPTWSVADPGRSVCGYAVDAVGAAYGCPATWASPVKNA